MLFPPEIPAEHRRFGLLSILRVDLQSSRTAALTSAGQRLLCRWTYTIVRSAEGGEAEIVGEIDPEGDVRLEETLAHSRAVLTSVVEHAPSLIYVKDVQGRYVMVKARALRAMKRTLPEMLGKTDEAFFPPEITAQVKAQDRAVLAAKGPVAFEYAVAMPGGERHVLITKFPVVDSAGVTLGLCGIGTDVTDRKRAEAERNEMQQALASALPSPRPWCARMPRSQG